MQSQNDHDDESEIAHNHTEVLEKLGVFKGKETQR